MVSGQHASSMPLWKVRREHRLQTDSGQWKNHRPPSHSHSLTFAHSVTLPHSIPLALRPHHPPRRGRCRYVASSDSRGLEGEQELGRIG